MSLTSLKDVDREILKHADDRQLLEICTIDRKRWNEVCDDNFLRRRLSKYPGIEKYKKENESWKRFFLRAVHFIAKMKEDHDFIYTDGNFEKQNQLFLDNEDMDYLLTEAAYEGELSLVKHAVNNGAVFYNPAVHNAAEKGHFEIMKYLVEKDNTSGRQLDMLLRSASRGGNLDIVKYLVDKGANIHFYDNAAIRYASRDGHLDVVKYLVEHGADPHADSDFALKSASRNGHLKIVKYLISLGMSEFSIRHAYSLAGYHDKKEVENYLKEFFE